MKIFKLVMIAAVALLGSLPLAASTATPQNFGRNWLFALGDDESASATDYDDSGWRKLSLPHDWAIEGDFSINNPSGTGGGALPGGIGWYRKHFDWHPDGKLVFIDFDGAYMNASVYINGHFLGKRPYGYASFSYELTPWLKDGENIIAVKVDNAEQPNSRWYSGCGIYRNVWLRTCDPVHFDQWGQYVVCTPVEGTNKWTVTVESTVENSSDKKKNLRLRSSINEIGGSTVETKLKLAPGEKKTVKQVITVSDPKLWDTENPALYTVHSTLSEKNKVLDDYRTATGFRTFAFDAEKGFFLNGKNMKINGVCLHHDAGALGAAVNRHALERQLRIMKEMGANAVRSTHNPPAPELLDLCDRMGLLVQDEAFDMWRKKKTEHDYSRYFNEWYERDLSDFIVRDRNHPCIMMWSIGNEVLEQWSHADADTLTLEQANLILNFGHDSSMLAAENSEMSINSLLTIRLADIVRMLDPTRPITAGCNEPNPGNHLFRSGALDIIGFNYHDDWFADVPNNFPGKPFIISESISALQTRGYYRMPSDSMYIWPERWDKPFYDESFSCSSYDNCHVPWGNTHEGTMRHVDDKDFIMGQFVWTGFDYIGEPTPYGWPARSSFFGIVDLAGIPKDVYYMYQSQWRPDKTVLHLFPHWNWEKGEQIDMWAYYNNADEVELFVNGKSQGIRRPDGKSYHAAWRVDYEPGTVEAVSRLKGYEVARCRVETAGEPAAVRLTPESGTMKADGDDLCYILAEIVDSKGRLCPLADNEIHFTVEGAGVNEGVDNGSPISLERFKADHRKAHYGKAMLIVRSNSQEGPVKVSATSDGLAPYDVTVTAKNAADTIVSIQQTHNPTSITQ